MYLAALHEIEGEKYKLNIEKCVRLVWESFVKAPCILLEKAGDIIGFAGLRTGVFDFCDDAYISEYMFYIKPKHRSAKTAHILSNAAKDVANKFNMPLYFTHFIDQNHTESRLKFLKRWGYKPVAINCIYEAK